MAVSCLSRTGIFLLGHKRGDTGSNPLRPGEGRQPTPHRRLTTSRSAADREPFGRQSVGGWPEDVGGRSAGGRRSVGGRSPVNILSCPPTLSKVHQFWRQTVTILNQARVKRPAFLEMDTQYRLCTMSYSRTSAEGLGLHKQGFCRSVSDEIRPEAKD